MKHKAETGVTCNLFTGILTKQLLKKAHAIMRSLGSTSIDTIYTLHSVEEEISDLSYISDVEPSADLFKLVVNVKGKSYRKSRRCIQKECNKLTTTYYSCCRKSYCYATESSRHTRPCMAKFFEEQKNKR